MTAPEASKFLRASGATHALRLEDITAKGLK